MTDSFDEPREYRLGIDPLKDLENDYFFNSFFKRPKKEMHYSKNRVYIGKYKKTGVPCYLDISEALRILILGMTRCLSADTLLDSPNGPLRIDEVKEGDILYGYDHYLQRKVFVKPIPLPPRKTKLYRVQFENGRVVTASQDHKFFTTNGDELIEIPLKECSVGTILFGDKQFTISSVMFAGEQEAYDLHVPDTNNFYLANGLLTHNSGKTWILRSLADRIHAAGNAVMFLPDVKDEMKSSIKPVQEKFRDLLDKRETPKGTPVIALRPSFFRRDPSDSPPEKNHWYSVHPLDLTQEDFFTMMNAQKMSAPQQTMMQVIHQAMKEDYADRREDFTLETFDELVDGLEDYSEQQKHHLKNRFAPLVHSGFYVPEYSRDIVDMMQNGFVPTINMEDFDRYSRSTGMNFPQVFFSIVLRTAINARRKKLIPPLFVMVDEASRFVPADGNPSSKHLVLECLHEDTLIATSDGDIPIKNVDPSAHDVYGHVLGSDSLVRVPFIKSRPKTKKMLRLRLSDGRSVLASPEHRFFVRDEKGQVQEKMLKNIYKGDTILTTNESQLSNMRKMADKEAEEVL